ncbi:MAG: class I SAM-dependent methyltransferase [Bacteroidota bacterium]
MKDKVAYWKRVLATIAYMPKRGVKALEVGCGPAGIFTLLHGEQQIIAIDPLIDRYESDLPHFDRSMYPDVHFESGMMESHESDEPYDVIYAFNTINHVSDWKAALKNLDNLLKPGGELLISSDVHRSPFLRVIFHLLPGDILHPHQHERKHYLDAFKQLGWKVEKEERIKREVIFDYIVWWIKK